MNRWRGLRLLWRSFWGLLGRRPLRWRRVHPEGFLRRPHYEWDGGFDLYVSYTTQVPPAGQGIAKIPCGIQLAQPEYCLLLVLTRSSTVERWLVVLTTLIDSYRGDIFIFVTNTRPQPVTIKAGERIAQVVPILTLAEAMPVELVDQLPPSHRGDKGFGSTGGAKHESK